MVDEAQQTGRFDPLPLTGFTKSYMHRREELREEVSLAGFEVGDLVGLEGIGFVLPDFAERWAIPSEREAARRVERIPELLGLSHASLVKKSSYGGP